MGEGFEPPTPLFLTQHFVEFVQLWMAVERVNLRPHIHDEIH